MSETTAQPPKYLIPLELANDLHKTISKNVRESENMNEGIRTGVFPMHYELQRNLKKIVNKVVILFLKGFGDTSEIVSLMCILSKKGETGKI